MRNISKPPAIVLGSGVTALGTMRCLSSAGITVLSFAREQGLERYSRYCLRIGEGHSGSLAEVLSSESISEAVLFPTSDHWLDELARNSEELRERCYWSIPSKEVLDLLVDKDALRSTLATYGVMSPETLTLNSLQELLAIDEQRFKTLFLKPCDSQSFFCHFGFKAFPVAGKEQTIEFFKQAEKLNLRMVLQEYVAGPASNYFYIEGFLDRDGNECARFIRRRDRMYPRDYGNSTMMTSISVESYPQALASLVDMLRQVGYQGIYSAEFKFDDAKHEAKLLEINCRPWWYIEFAKNCGINFAQLAYQDALGQDVSRFTSYQEGRSLIYPYYDAHVIRELWREGERECLTWGWSWLKSDYAVWQLADPVPALKWLYSRVRVRILRLFGWQEDK